MSTSTTHTIEHVRRIHEQAMAEHGTSEVTRRVAEDAAERIEDTDVELGLWLAERADEMDTPVSVEDVLTSVRNRSTDTSTQSAGERLGIADMGRAVIAGVEWVVTSDGGVRQHVVAAHSYDATQGYETIAEWYDLATFAGDDTAEAVGRAVGIDYVTSSEGTDDRIEID